MHGVMVVLWCEAKGLLLLLCMPPIVVATEQSSRVSVNARKKKMEIEDAHVVVSLMAVASGLQRQQHGTC